MSKYYHLDNKKYSGFDCEQFEDGSVEFDVEFDWAGCCSSGTDTKYVNLSKEEAHRLAHFLLSK